MIFNTDWSFKVCWWLPSNGCQWCLKESWCHRESVFCFGHFGHQHVRYNAQHIWFQVSSYMIILEKKLRKIFDFVIFFPLLRFSFKSFSFNKAGNGSQKISCNINFCLKDNNECTTKTDLAKLTCNASEPEKWIKPSN